ncbi:hypothetical protein [Crossiella sp. CA198]|uniref:hypothetical protein n=1 Tax=Crossiella sp. CA198 TaxID=3455607 RepID=UPI003F8D1FCF
MTDETEGVDEEVSDSPEVSRILRWTAGIAAIASGGAGATAVFITSNQAGTAVLLAFSALLTLIALSGRLPSKLKFGDHEVSMPIAKAIAKKIDQAEPDDAKELVEAVALSHPGAFSGQGFIGYPRITYERRARTYEVAVARALRSFSASDHRVEVEGGPQLGFVHIRARDQIKTYAYRNAYGAPGHGKISALKEVIESAKQTRFSGFIFFTSEFASVDVRVNRIEVPANVHIVQTGEDASEVMQAVSEALHNLIRETSA